MSATTLEATDEVFALFRTYWLANSPAQTPSGLAPEVRLQGVAYTANPKLPYCVASITDSGRPVQYLADGNSTVRIQRTAFVTIQIRVKPGEGDSFGLRLAQVARAAFERRDTASGVFFFGCQITRHTETKEDPFAQFTVTADFSYGEIVS